MARAPGKCLSMFFASSAAKPASESPASRSTACAKVPADSSTSLGGSAAKPASDQQQACSVASESTTLTLADVFSNLEGNASNADAQQLIQDIPVLQQWNTSPIPVPPTMPHVWCLLCERNVEWVPGIEKYQFCLKCCVDSMSTDNQTMLCTIHHARLPGMSDRMRAYVDWNNQLDLAIRYYVHFIDLGLYQPVTGRTDITWGQSCTHRVRRSRGIPIELNQFM